jgi:hypothetical protein
MAISLIRLSKPSRFRLDGILNRQEILELEKKSLGDPEGRDPEILSFFSSLKDLSLEYEDKRVPPQEYDFTYREISSLKSYGISVTFY